MTDTMIEEVAEIHYNKYFEGVQDLEPRWAELPDDARSRFIESMRAAIAAIIPEGSVVVPREATDAMVRVGIAYRNAVEMPNIKDTAGIYRAMIQAAEGG